MHTFIVRDMRLNGLTPAGDVMEVDSGTPLQHVFDRIKGKSVVHRGDLKVVFMCDGSAGFLQCAHGAVRHPRMGNGISIHDLDKFEQIKDKVKCIDFLACYVALIGRTYDGNHFCYRVAQTARAEVKASIDAQKYYTGMVKGLIFNRPSGQGIDFGPWNGKVFTWSKDGEIIDTHDFPFFDP